MAEEIVPGQTVPVSSAVDPNTIAQQTLFYNGQLADQLPAVDVQTNLVKEFGSGVNGNAGEISNGDLPWSTVAMPVTAAGVGGIGHNQHALQVGSWVLGYFADGEDCQQFIVTHTLMGGAGGGTAGGFSTGSASGDSNAGSSTADGAASPKYSPTEAQNIAVKKLLSLGYTKVQAAGIIGNLMAESSASLNPSLVNSTNHSGIAQWDTGRFANCRKLAASKGTSPYDLNTQLEFVDYELKHSEGKAMRLLQNSTTASDAARAFMAFERPEGYDAHRQGFDGADTVKDKSRRIQNAVNVFSKMNNETTK